MDVSYCLGFLCHPMKCHPLPMHQVDWTWIWDPSLYVLCIPLAKWEGTLANVESLLASSRRSTVLLVFSSHVHGYHPISGGGYFKLPWDHLPQCTLQHPKPPTSGGGLAPYSPIPLCLMMSLIRCGGVGEAFCATHSHHSRMMQSATLVLSWGDWTGIDTGGTMCILDVPLWVWQGQWVQWCMCLHQIEKSSWPSTSLFVILKTQIPQLSEIPWYFILPTNLILSRLSRLASFQSHGFTAWNLNWGLGRMWSMCLGFWWFNRVLILLAGVWGTPISDLNGLACPYWGYFCPHWLNTRIWSNPLW